MTSLRTDWHEGHPPVGRVVIVWYWVLNQTIRATWDGTDWRTVEGMRLGGITHWHEA